MEITARYGAAVHLEGDRIVVSRGPGAAALVELRSVSAPLTEVSAVELRRCGRLPYVAVHVVGQSAPERPFDNWSVPVEDVAAAEELVRTIQHHTARAAQAAGTARADHAPPAALSA